MYVDDYLKKFPQGKYINQIEELTWQKALNKEAEKTAFKAEGFEEYLKYFPLGNHHAVAREKIKKYKL